MTTPYQRQIARKLVSLRRDLLPLMDRLLALFNSDSPCVVEPQSKTSAPFGGQHAAYYNSLGARFFTISPAFRFRGENQVNNKMFSGEVTVESDPVKLGALTYNHCIDAVYLCWTVLEKLFFDDSEILSINWARCRVRPRAVFALEQDLGCEDLFLHDVLLIRLCGGTAFVFNPTVYQFDFGHYLQEWSAYRTFVTASIMLNPVSEARWHEQQVSPGALKTLRRRREEMRTKTREDILCGKFGH